jgi:hypothetical protein
VGVEESTFSAFPSSARSREDGRRTNEMQKEEYNIPSEQGGADGHDMGKKVISRYGQSPSHKCVIGGDELMQGRWSVGKEQARRASIIL